MPVDKIKVQHKFGIISHNHRQNLLERISAPATPTKSSRKPIPCEISHDFILSYNNADPLSREKLDIQAEQLLQRVKRRAGILSGGTGRHVHIPRSWVELTLLARCRGHFRDEVLEALLASMITASPSIDNIPSLFLVCETVIEWIKELGNPIPETAWSKTQILTYSITELCFWRAYGHALLHNLHGCGSFLSDLSWHIENLDFVRKVYSKYPDGELLLRQLESIKTVVSEVQPVKKEMETATKKSFISAGLMHGLEFYQSVRKGADPAASLSALLTTLSLLGTEDYLNTVLAMKLLTIVSCKNYLALQILQAAATGRLPLQGNAKCGVCKSSFRDWDWVTATGFVHLLVEVAIRGSTSEIQKSAIQAGEMVSVRVDSAPVHGYGLLDLVSLNSESALSPAVQYALQQGLTRVHIHIMADPLRKSSAHLLWTSLQTMKDCAGHRIIVGIAQNKTECFQAVHTEIEPESKLLFEQMFDTLSDRYIPQSVSVSNLVTKPGVVKTSTSKSDHSLPQKGSQISVISKPGSVIKLSNTSKTYPRPILPLEARHNKVLQDVVADQWYKELMNVFRAAERAQQSVVECEEQSEAERNHAERFISELDLSETEVSTVMNTLVQDQK